MKFKLYAVRDKRDKKIERMFNREEDVELYFDSHKEAVRALRLHCTDYNFPIGRYEVITIRCTVEEEDN